MSGYQAKGGSYTAANELQVGTSGIGGKIDVAVSYSSGANSFYVSFGRTAVACRAPPARSWDNLSSNTSYTYGGCCGLVTINNTGLSLFAGASYFMVLGPENFISDTSESWNLNSVGATGLDLYFQGRWPHLEQQRYWCNAQEPSTSWVARAGTQYSRNQ